MANSCPECGTEMVFEEHEVRLRTGTCPSCAKEFAVVEGRTVASRLASTKATAGPETFPERPGERGAVGTPACEDCGAPLVVREGRNGSLEATCEDCDTTTVFVPRPEAMQREGRRERPDRLVAGAPRGRPCRKCGGPLRFSTDDTGMLVGECESCGNRFVLPPRSGGQGGVDARRPPPFGRRDFPYRSTRRSFNPARGAARGGRSFRESDRTGTASYDSEGFRRKRRRQKE